MFAFLTMNDLRYAFRQLLKNPGFTAVAVLTLALGIGATTAIVRVVKTAVFDPLPVRHPERFVQLGVVHKERGWWPGINPLALRDVRQQTNLFARLAAYSDNDGLTLRGDEFPQSVPGVWVTPEFFGLLDVPPLLGRTFTADEGQPGKDDVLVISHRLWQRQFGGDPAIIGHTVSFLQRPMTVVGVMPPHFSFPRARFVEYWRPAQPPDPATDDFMANTGVILEMRSGVEARQVQAFLDIVSQRQAKESQIAAEYEFQCRDLREMFSTREVRRTLGLLLGAIAFVLFIAAANVANLQLARTETRHQELAVRAALGAGRARVFRQLLTESLLLAVLGGAAGLAVTAFGLDPAETHFGGRAAPQTHRAQRGRPEHRVRPDTRHRSALRSRAGVARLAVQLERSAEVGRGHQHAGSRPQSVQSDVDRGAGRAGARAVGGGGIDGAQRDRHVAVESRLRPSLHHAC